MPQVLELQTYIFQTLQRTHDTVDGGFRHPTELFTKKEKKKNQFHRTLNCALQNMNERTNSPSLQRYGLPVAGARGLGPRRTPASGGPSVRQGWCC
jgi:hypothetical protein